MEQLSLNPNHRGYHCKFSKIKLELSQIKSSKIINLINFVNTIINHLFIDQILTTLILHLIHLTIPMPRLSLINKELYFLHRLSPKKELTSRKIFHTLNINSKSLNKSIRSNLKFYLNNPKLKFKLKFKVKFKLKFRVNHNKITVFNKFKKKSRSAVQQLKIKSNHNKII